VELVDEFIEIPTSAAESPFPLSQIVALPALTGEHFAAPTARTELRNQQGVTA
jgi:hypothetical protein